MNVKEYIDSGVLYDYCTGALSTDQMIAVERVCELYPEVQSELAALQIATALPLHEDKASPAPGLQESIWNTLDNINKEKTGDINAKPIINKYTDYNNWKRIVKPFMPAEYTGDGITHVLRHSDGVTQVLIVSQTDVPEEVHVHERESFLVLEGECECRIGDNTYRLGPGGFIEIPLHTPHNVMARSPWVVAILQHIAL